MPTPEEKDEYLRRLIASEEETHVEFPVPPYPTEQVDDVYEDLPHRVDERDMDATRVAPAAFQPVSQPRPPQKKNRKNREGAFAQFRQLNWGCFLRAVILFIFGVIVLGIIGSSYAIYQYNVIASTLPEVGDLRARASQFETTRILDSEGHILYEILDPNAGRRTYIPLEGISPYLIAATIATEDKEFYYHPGFDAIAVIRALWQNYTSGEIVSGASTIPQQLARMLLLSQEERYEQSYKRKAREIILAAEITRRYSKDEILELYLNEVYYGNLAYGIEAAAESYFNTTADKLTLGQATFLAGLPQSPSIHDIFANREGTLFRHRNVIYLTYRLSQEKDCIEVSNSEEPVCVGALEAAQAAEDIENYPFVPPNINIRYPHWVSYVRSLLDEKYDAQTIYRSGFTVHTTIDPALQDMAQQILTEQVTALQDRNVQNGALVAIDPKTGKILAMVGSPDFDNAAISGQVNMATSPTRQPGSSIKPITYLAAFEKGWTPATLIWDVPSEFPPSGDPNDPREPYIPINYDGKAHGPVTLRVALSNSFNIPAVKTLDFVGIYDNPDTEEKEGMIAMAERLGITSLIRDDYGLSLTLGGGEVSLLEMTGAFAVMANEGVRVPPVAITKILDHRGEVVYEYTPPQGEQVLRRAHAFLISSILSDNATRTWMFGPNSYLNLPFPAAAKTGTSNDFRDNWTLGYTSNFVTGVWVGNADYTPMNGTTGLSGAAPIWSQFMQAAAPQFGTTTFTPPDDIITKVICSISGTEPSNSCKSGKQSEYFVEDQPPLPPGMDLWRKVTLDTWTGLEAAKSCDDFTKTEMVMRVEDKWARKWLGTKSGKNWLQDHDFPKEIVFAPKRECNANDPYPELRFTNIAENEKITDTSVQIRGVVAVSENFGNWSLAYGKGEDPSNWEAIVEESSAQYDKPEKLGVWDLEGLENGIYTLRLLLKGDKGDATAERVIRVNVDLPAPTPTPTLTPTDTATLPPTPTATNTSAPSPTATSTSTPTATDVASPTASFTPLPTDTPTPSLTPMP